MAADYRSVQTRMWREDDWFQTLDVDARLFWIYLFTNPSASPAGIYRLPVRTMAFECGVDADRIDELFAEFAAVGKAYYEASVVWIVNMRRLQFPTLIDGSREWQTAIRIAKDVDAIPDRCTLKSKYIKHSGYPIIVETMEGERVIRRVSIDYEYRIDTLSILHSEGMDTPSIYVTKPNVTKPNVTKPNVTVGEPTTADAVPPAQPQLLSAPEKIKRARKENPDKAHPAVQAYYDLHKRWPQNAQIALIVERDPPIANWVRAIRTWAGKGYNPQNIAAMLDWAENPAKIDKAANGYTTQDGKYIPTNGAADDDDIPTYKKLAVLA